MCACKGSAAGRPVLALCLLLFGWSPHSEAQPPPGTGEDTEQTAPPQPIPDKGIPVTGEETPAEPPEAPQVLEKLVVTATKRAEYERDIPESVGAISGRTLEESRAQSLKDYVKLVPGVSYNDQGTDASVPIIRGIATEIGFGTTSQTSGIYLDDMPFADLFVPLSLPDLNPFDLDRVEVLKGPQGTLFGAGALSGAVRYITHKPDKGLWEAKLMETTSETQLSDGRTQVLAGAANIPLTSAAALRFVGVKRGTAGLYDMSASDSTGTALRDDPDADQADHFSGRALASWTPSARLGLSAMYFGQRTKLDDSTMADQRGGPTSAISPFASPREYEFSGGNVLATYDFDRVQLLSSSNVLEKHNHILNHAEWFFGLQDQNQNEWYDLAISDVSGVTQELRLASLPDASGWPVKWLIGASYMRYANDYFQYEPNPGPRGTPPPDKPGDLSTTERAQSFLFAVIDSVGTEQAMFGQATLTVSDKWEFTAGLRGYKTGLVADTVLSGSQVVALTQQTEVRDHFEPTSRGINPKLGVRYLVSDDVSLYALAAKGFQFGGVQVNPSTPTLEQSANQAGFEFGPYDSSTLWSYEGGIRTTWLDDRVQFDAGAFRLDWTDLQVTVRVPISGTSGTFGLIANVGEAHSDGLEATFRAIPYKGLTFQSNATWIRAVTDVQFDEGNPAGPVPAGTRLPGTPRFQYSNVLSYETSVPYLDEWTIGPVVTHLHVGTSPDALRATGAIGGFDSFDARLAVSNHHSELLPELCVGVTNATDTRAVTYHSRLTSLTTGDPFDFYHFIEPRTVFVSLSLRY